MCHCNFIINHCFQREKFKFHNAQWLEIVQSHKAGVQGASGDDPNGIYDEDTGYGDTGYRDAGVILDSAGGVSGMLAMVLFLLNSAYVNLCFTTLMSLSCTLIHCHP